MLDGGCYFSGGYLAKKGISRRPAKTIRWIPLNHRTIEAILEQKEDS